MAVAGVHVPVLQLGGGGQQVVGIVGGVGLKMLQHHSKQVLAGKALNHPARVGRHRHGVTVVHHQRLNGWAKFSARRAQQVISNGAHVDGSRPPASQQVGPLQRSPVYRKAARA